MAHQVFISYSSQDKEVADNILSSLEEEKIECWIAPRDITPGKEWGEEIVEAIRGSKIMVLLFSSASNDSQQVLREVERAVNKNVIIIPFRIEDVEPTKSLEYFLYSTHWLDAFNSELESSIERLKQTIEKLLEEYNSKKISKECHNCEAENNLENRFCKECGTELNAEINKEDILKEVEESVFFEQQDYQQKLYQASRKLYRNIQSKAKELFQFLQDYYQTADNKQKLVVVASVIVLLLLVAVTTLNLGVVHEKEKQQVYRTAEDYYQQENYEKAIKLYQQAATEGNKEAQYMLGFMYMGGKGVEQNEKQAEKWYLKAAQQGNKDAQVALGAMYKYGLGIEKDLEEAEKWYQKAAQQGSETAKQELKELAAKD